MKARRAVAIIGGALTVAAVTTVADVPKTSSPAAAQTAPVPNPPIEETCGVDVTLVLDASGSINSSHAVEDVRAAADAFLDALRNTNSTARVTQFGTVSAQLAARTGVDDASLGPGGALSAALAGYYNPIPPAVPPQTFRRYDGSGSPLSASNYGAANTTSNQYTNWDQALDQAGTGAPPEMVLFVTDGDPTAFDFNQAGDPFLNASPPFNVAYGTDASSAAQSVTLDRAVQEANQIKADTRILAVGVGEALDNQASEDRLVAVSGDQVVRDADLGNLDSLNDVDVALVTNFANLAQFLREVVLQLCSPSLTIRKVAQTADNNAYVPAEGWPMTVTPSALPPGTGFTWILPDPAPAPSKTVPTDEGGFATFQWEPIPPEADSQAIVQETLQPGYTPGRPGDVDFVCVFRDELGNVRSVQGELNASLSFTLNPIGQEIVTCTIWNSFNYAPAIGITKVNAPTAVRGDINPPATVTSSYEVTNEGNTPLSNVRVVDDKCAPVTGQDPNAGDTNVPPNGLLDLDEVWEFTCTRPAVVSRGAAPTQTIVNEATVTGTDPTGETVEASDTDDVDVYFPAINLTKLVDDPATAAPPAESVTVPQGTPVDYTYSVTNTGNTPLASVSLVDDTPPCEAPTPDPGNTAPPLLPGQTWNYSCTDVTPTGDVINTATVSGLPLNPDTGAPFTGNNPPVTATDFAEVDVVNPNIELVKSVDPEVVLLGPDGAPEPVTYTFEATNTGTPELNRPGATAPGPAKDPGWIQDTECTDDAIYVSGDTDDDDLLDPGETWTFTCPGSITEPTLNIAGILAQPSDANGAPLPGVPPVFDLATAFVNVLQPGISVDKIALVGVVLDGGAEPVAGPDVPTPRPAEYRYEVTNTGNVELGLDPNPPAEDPTRHVCAPLVFVEGDTDGDDLLDVDETWVYSCSIALDRDDNNVGPPPGDLSGVVQNQVNVTGVPFFEGALVPDKSVTDSDTSTVQVIEPGLTITKTASAEVVLPGTAVTYTYEVTNTGDVGLTVLGPEDDQCAPLNFEGGDRPPFNGILEGANSGAPETFTYTCTRVLEMPPEPATTHVNNVAVGGVDPLGNLYLAADTAVVRVFDPAINLTKTVSDELVLSGTTVTYDFTVTNTGTSPIPADDVLANVVLVDDSDPPVPTCDSPTFVGGDTNGDDLLQREPVETWTYECSAAITDPTTDVALVTGTGGTQFQPPLPVDVSAEAAAFVQPFNPAIEITKTAAPTRIVGSGPVTYTYEVRNTGDVPLSNVAERITDDTCSPLTFVGGDQDGDGLLDTINSIFEDALDETWRFRCTMTIAETTTNTVVVTGTPTESGGIPLCREGESTLECDVDDQDTATVVVVPPAPGALAITKDVTSGPDRNPDGTFTLAYDVVVSNTGGTPIAYDLTDEFLFAEGVEILDVVVENIRPGDIPVNENFDGESDQVIASATLAPGANHRYRITVTADVGGVTDVDALDCELDPGEDGTGFLNRATVNPSAEDCAPIDTRADIRVDKVVDRTTVEINPANNVRTRLTYTIVVTNDGPGVATDVVVTDTLPGGVVPVSAVPSVGSCTRAGAIVTCELGTMAPEAEEEIVVTIELLPTQPVGPVRNSVAVETSSPGDDPANNVSAAVTVVRRPGQLPATGNAGLATPLTVATTLLLAGSAMVVVARRRRRPVV